MLRYQEAQQLQTLIQQEAPKVEVRILSEVGQPDYYCLAIYLYGQPRFVVRSLDQWNQRKKMLKS
ncbi:MAG: hypothetical protein IRZ31_04755 [Thermogemmatispora sp.]|uniref:hypothetical protein n=1 Tax=Thermogemmatispora sp. TaxID=1968838 RepID=UPI00262B299E|nr:hypothetical protein [Thermogemmatispora sp.]MBX5456191.1 hypothetical protein [Thermogemmatispora sp.]